MPEFTIDSDLDGVSMTEAAIASESAESEASEEWRLYVSPEGHAYYFNHNTEESVWADQDYEAGDTGECVTIEARIVPGSPTLGWLSRVSSVASIIASAIDPLTPRSATVGTPRSEATEVINDLSLPERLAGRVANLLERTITSHTSVRASEGDMESGLATMDPAGEGSPRKYRPASELRELGLLPPLPPPSVALSFAVNAGAFELPPPSPRSVGATRLAPAEEEV
jgi:hypothetical protein